MMTNTLPTYRVECNDCRYDRGMFDVMMNAVAIESQGASWVNVKYQCPMCHEFDYSMFPCSLAQLNGQVNA